MDICFFRAHKKDDFQSKKKKTSRGLSDAYFMSGRYPVTPAGGENNAFQAHWMVCIDPSSFITYHQMAGSDR
jgi:hypothetical protein